MFVVKYIKNSMYLAKMVTGQIDTAKLSELEYALSSIWV